jgi:hypothetical protein
MSSTVSTGADAQGAINIKYLMFAFIAGFIAVPLGHQVMAYIYYLTIPGRAFPWNMGPANAAAFKAFGLPTLINLSFWGGVWGLVWALIAPYCGKGIVKYVVALLFGGVVVTAGAAYLVPTIKSLPLGSLSWIGFGLNGAWGVVTALLLDLMAKKRLG